MNLSKKSLEKNRHSSINKPYPLKGKTLNEYFYFVTPLDTCQNLKSTFTFSAKETQT